MVTPTHNAVRTLGRVQQDVARRLTRTPVTAADLVRYAGNDRGYTSMVLIRLAEREVAREVSEGHFVRGALWTDAAMYYHWETAE